MKKRILALLVALVVCFPLCACGGGESASAPAEDNKNEVVFEEGTVVMENANAKVELVKFYEEEDSEGNVEKYVTFKVKNVGDVDFMFGLEDVYIGDEGVTDIMLDGNVGPAPGKSMKFTYKIAVDDEDYTPIESLDLLYDLNGSMEVYTYTPDGEYLDTEYEEDFSIADLGLK